MSFVRASESRAGDFNVICTYVQQWLTVGNCSQEAHGLDVWPLVCL